MRSLSLLAVVLVPGALLAQRPTKSVAPPPPLHPDVSFSPVLTFDFSPTDLAFGFEFAPFLSSNFAFAPDMSFGFDIASAYAPKLWDLETDSRHYDLETNLSHYSDAALAITPFSGSGLSSMRPIQGTAADSAYRAGREALNRGEYLRASEIFRVFEQKYPKSRFAPAALYWQAFALYRVGTEARLQEALAALQTTRARLAKVDNDADVAALQLRVQAALAARGNAAAAAQLRATAAQGVSCDKEEMEVRAEALNALVRMDEAQARPLLDRVLARRDECSVALRRRAVYILGRSDQDGVSASLIKVIDTDPSEQVKRDAVSMLGQISSPTNLSALERLVQTSTASRIQQAAISAIRSQRTPEALSSLRRLIENAEMEERLRASAISSLATAGRYSLRTSEGGSAWSISTNRNSLSEAEIESNGAYLRNLYPKVEGRRLRTGVISGIGRIGGKTNTDWLLALAQNTNEESTYRSYALSQIKTSLLTVQQISQMYDAMTSRALRTRLISLLSRHDDSTATDKLLEIARQGTDPQVRRSAISALVRRKDPRATRLLLELVEK